MGRSKDRCLSIGLKMHSTPEECSQTTDIQLFSTSPDDNSKVSQSSYAEIASSKPLNDSAIKTENLLFPQKLVGSVQTSKAAERSDNKYFNKECGDGLHVGVTASLPQEESPEASGSAFQFSKHVEEISSRIEKLPFLQESSPFITYAVPTAEFNEQLLCRTKFTNETTENGISVSGRNRDEFFRKASASIEQGIVFRLLGQIENLIYESGIINGNKEIRFENEFRSSGKNEESVMESEHLPSERRMEEISSQLAAINHTNSAQAENQGFQFNSSLHYISLKSRQLCSEVHRNSKDFAKKLFSHIAFLNDILYIEQPPFYFNTNVKKVVEYAWMGVKDYVINQSKGQKINFGTYRQMLVLCTQSWLPNESFDLFLFLRYCVMICQIGVQAIKCNVKEIPLDVITFLTNKINEVENAFRDCFECNVETISDNIVDSLRL